MTEKDMAIVMRRATLVDGKVLQPPKRFEKPSRKEIHQVAEKLARELVAMEKAEFYREPEEQEDPGEEKSDE